MAGRGTALAALAAVLAALAASAGCGAALAAGGDPRPVGTAVVCRDPAVEDQDDMCIWVDPKDPARSTIVASDKAAAHLFVYDLAGKTLQSIETPKPGNIDVRYGFPLGGRKVDIVAFNQRTEGYRIVVFAVDPASRRLARVDNGAILTRANYGGTLYHSRKTGDFCFITTSMPGHAEQWLLADDGAGKVRGSLVRTWQVGFSEAAVGDDEAGKVYVGQESKGVWELPGEPDDPAPPRLVIKTGEHGLHADAEGIAIHPNVAGQGRCLVVSNQSRDDFKVYRLDGRFTFVGTFEVAGARDTDGLDVTAADLGGPFAEGLFACHTDRQGKPVLLVPWARIAAGLQPPADPQAAPAPEPIRAGGVRTPERAAKGGAP